MIFILLGSLVFLAIIFSAIFSATEAAFLSTSSAKLQTLAKAGNKKAELVNKLKLKMEQVIGTLLICNNLVNIFASAIATGIMVMIFGESGVIYSTIIMTVLIVLFAEAIPKFYAMRKSETFAMFAAYPLSILLKICYPITKMFDWSAKGLLRIFGVKVGNNLLSSTIEELRGIIDLHQGDEEATEERAMLHSVLDLGDVDVAEIMVHRKDIKLLNIDDDLNKIITEVVESSHTRFPVWQHNPDNIVGIMHTKNLLRIIHLRAKQKNIITRDDMLSITSKPWFLPDTTTLFEQLQAFKQRREHIGLVVDEYGALQGLVTLEDIIEEIVGNIDDEHDIQQREFWSNNSGEIWAIGTATVRDLNRSYNLNLPDEEASTIAGLIMYESRSIPKIGQKFKIANFKIQVLGCLKNQITLVKIVSLNTKKIIKFNK